MGKLSKDYVLVCKVVQHLIMKDNVLIVLSTPSRLDEESNQDGRRSEFWRLIPTTALSDGDIATSAMNVEWCK